MNLAKASLAILLLGNAVLYFGWWTHAEPRTLDRDALARSVPRILVDGTWVEQPFDDETDLPDEYLHLHARGDSRWKSFYAAHYPRQDLGSDQPHDPVLCYEALGWTVMSDVTPCRAVVDGRGRELDLAFFEIERAGVRRTVYFWEQEAGRLPRARGEDSSWFADLWRRYRGGRSDRVWIRLVGRGVEAVDETEGARLRALMSAVATAMR